MHWRWLTLLAVAGVIGDRVDLMTTLNDFKALRYSVPAEVQSELYRLFTSDPEASYKRMVEIAAEKGITVTADEVRGFLNQTGGR